MVRVKYLDQPAMLVFPALLSLQPRLPPLAAFGTRALSHIVSHQFSWILIVTIEVEDTVVEGLLKLACVWKVIQVYLTLSSRTAPPAAKTEEKGIVDTASVASAELALKDIRDGFAFLAYEVEVIGRIPSWQKVTCIEYFALLIYKTVYQALRCGYGFLEDPVCNEAVFIFNLIGLRRARETDQHRTCQEGSGSL